MAGQTSTLPGLTSSLPGARSSRQPSARPTAGRTSAALAGEANAPSPPGGGEPAELVAELARNKLARNKLTASSSVAAAALLSNRRHQLLLRLGQVSSGQVLRSGQQVSSGQVSTSCC